MKIAIIGGAGFIGTSLTELLLRSKYSPFIIDKKLSEVYPDRCRIADMRNLELLCSAVRGTEVVYNLAAEHKDNVLPRSLYYKVNVEGAENVCEAARRNGIKKIIFTSTVAVYGFAPPNTDESGRLEPFNEYGRTKMLAEEVYRAWARERPDRTCVIVRPTVVFGENNRGNVYAMIKQINSGKFIMMGNGTNVKSMAYIENVSAFLEYSLRFGRGIHLFNYVDKPDLDMNTLVSCIRKMLGKDDTSLYRLPYIVGYTGGRILDLISFFTKKQFAVSGIRIKKFCTTTRFDTVIPRKTDFIPPIGIQEGLKKTIEYEFPRALEKGTGSR